MIGGGCSEFVTPKKNICTFDLVVENEPVHIDYAGVLCGCAARYVDHPHALVLNTLVGVPTADSEWL